MFAAHHKLNQLRAVIDVNGQQALGRTENVIDCGNLADRWRSFGWEAIEVDGNDVDAIAQALLGHQIGEIITIGADLGAAHQVEIVTIEPAPVDVPPANPELVEAAALAD